ncbi:hypothetical protein [Phaeobacter piscinae]|uniref:hypothetical protein n=1 Tax=Phaeobacter piscinae TaxID=1580596 RepID=UPI000C9BF4F3|nr:hypothetical protein [Phaeobacter piscinae]AUQ75284.1 hypothetical protein PhaeoP71_02437 [Phaeobacter piscinae]
MQTKLHINLSQGIIDVEGDVELVKAIYEDFKDRLATQTKPASNHEPTGNRTDDEAQQSTKRTKSSRKPSTSKRSKPAEINMGINPDSPKFDKNLDTKDLKEFYEGYNPSSAPEKILIFLKFLTDKLEIESPNTDQVYTCFSAVKEKVPAAFAQAFRDTSSKKGFIDYNSATDIRVTIAGNNHFNFELDKEACE